MDRPRGRSLRWLLPLAVCLWSDAALGQAVPPILDEFGDEEKPQSLRERLTEREDEIRLENPTQIDVLGRPLTLSGQYELSLDFARRSVLGSQSGDSRALLLGQEIEAEIFYPLGNDTFLFLQGRAAMDRFLHAPDGTDQVEDYFLERGEMWLFFKDLLEGRLHVEIGRLDYEDDRTFWFDQELDSIRVELEGDDVDVALAFGREVTPERTGFDDIEPGQDGVLRWIGEVGWEWIDEHALELYLIRQSDHSYSEPIGKTVSIDRQDESDATLTWIGPRALGAWESPERGALGYWLDGGYVWGRETQFDYEDISARRATVVDRARRDVRGWAVDAGLTWAMPHAHEPRLTLGVAVGSGDDSPDSDTDRAFRQTGIQGNESGFGGVERFHHYGVLLAPELSNLRVLTLGVGMSLFTASSLDLIFHDYHLLARADELFDSALELELSGRRKHVGSELDLVLAVEEWARVQFEMRGAIFRAGAAVDSPHDWSFGGFATLRVAF